jgi:hypothetical protein
MAATTSFPVRCSGSRARRDVEGTVRPGKKAGARDGLRAVAASRTSAATRAGAGYDRAGAGSCSSVIDLESGSTFSRRAAASVLPPESAPPLSLIS